MGMFDHVRCRYPLPDAEAQDLDFQTKSMPAPFLDNYLITEDGRLLHEAYDARCEEDAKAPLGLWLHRENPRWERVDFRGELEIHDYVDDPVRGPLWYSYLFWFRDGKVADLQHGLGHGPLPNVPRIRRAK
jgi:hypothetical protein